MRSVKELRQELYSKVENYYKDKLGFKGSQGVYKRQNEKVVFSDTSYPGNLYISPWFSLEIEEMTKINKKLGEMAPGGLMYHQNHEAVLSILHHPDDRIKNSPHHLGANSGHYSKDHFGYPVPHNNYKFSFEEGIDLQPFLDEHFYFYENIISPLFTRIKTLEDLFLYYNEMIINQPLDKCSEPEFVQRIAWRHRFKGLSDALITARACGYSNMEELILKYVKIYQSTPSNGVPVIPCHDLFKLYAEDYYYLLPEKYHHYSKKE